MKYLVISDNHGDRDVLVDVINRWRDGIDVMIHCGDSELSPEDELWESFDVRVKGNCDFDSRYPERVTYEKGNERFYVTHGHLSRVRAGLHWLAHEAEEQNATICLFGHTHQLGVEKIDDILYLNPGSIRLPRGRYMIKTYAIIESCQTQYKVDYYDQGHQKVPELSCQFQK
ncbi:metallophosphoesterase [Vagococcus lutrae]|uniref:metallophosphoesterase n=1 Tax=Vagococcus lutrae TaxID=81947 RepID=UPI002010069F|nr:metallophosphoesterase [Vagococcus lutrae]MDT2805390.1 metallophosphoesterase [Vagococcus lutrae]MDT2823693.1 metallophosphoesterase [Vagococcus lutrae]UQF19432.1 metallophosphoesterase [Vagococcus lutrae]